MEREDLGAGSGEEALSDLRQIPEADLNRMYEAEKQRYIAEHPDATPEEYQKALTELARRLGV